jgi:hypothetical protein
MRPNRCLIVLSSALIAAAPVAHAQQTADPDPVMPRPGSWGAEAVLGSWVGANVLRFSSPTAAWVAGLTFNVSHQTEEFTGFTGTTEQSGLLGYGDARLGRRWWSGDRGERIRPLTGLGVLGGVSSNEGFQSWNVGAYGELGASYFVSPHVSLGATGELAAVYLHDRFRSTGAERNTTRWLVRGNLVRVNASVYF